MGGKEPHPITFQALLVIRNDRNDVTIERGLFAAGFESERRMLWEDVLPRLRSRVQSLELDVQLVDVEQHPGALSPAENHLDGHAHLRHLDMIADCHRMSCGPFFLVSIFRQTLHLTQQLLLRVV